MLAGTSLSGQGYTLFPWFGAETKAQDVLLGPALCSRPGQEGMSLSPQGCPCQHVKVVLDYLH